MNNTFFIIFIVFYSKNQLLYKLVTPPLPLPYKGGERLPPTYPQAFQFPKREGSGYRQPIRRHSPPL